MNDINLKAKKDQSNYALVFSYEYKLLCSRDLVEIKSSLVNIYKNILRIKLKLDFFQVSFSNPSTRNLCPISIEFRHSNTSAII